MYRWPMYRRYELTDKNTTSKTPDKEELCENYCKRKV